MSRAAHLLREDLKQRQDVEQGPVVRVHVVPVRDDEDVIVLADGVLVALAHDEERPAEVAVQAGEVPHVHVVHHAARVFVQPVRDDGAVGARHAGVDPVEDGVDVGVRAVAEGDELVVTREDVEEVGGARALERLPADAAAPGGPHEDVVDVEDERPQRVRRVDGVHVREEDVRRRLCGRPGGC